RFVLNDTTLPHRGGPDGSQKLFLPKGTYILAGVPTIHMDPEIWGPDAHEYQPDRWLDEGFQSRPRYSYMPFSEGRRHCPGELFALVVA
ncbi:n-alkane-inducible cytochrome P-450, partial [Pseudomassariella vexata]